MAVDKAATLNVAEMRNLSVLGIWESDVQKVGRGDDRTPFFPGTGDPGSVDSPMGGLQAHSTNAYVRNIENLQPVRFPADSLPSSRIVL